MHPCWLIFLLISIFVANTNLFRIFNIWVIYWYNTNIKSSAFGNQCKDKLNFFNIYSCIKYLTKKKRIYKIHEPKTVFRLSFMGFIVSSSSKNVLKNLLPCWSIFISTPESYLQIYRHFLIKHFQSFLRSNIIY